jgi:hypothetical protein
MSRRSLTKIAGSGSASGSVSVSQKVRIRGSGAVPKFHGSATLVEGSESVTKSYIRSLFPNPIKAVIKKIGTGSVADPD